MNVRCPHCASAYLLPDHLLGPRGARVRCPNCSQAFVVLRDVEPLGEVSVAASLPEPAPAHPSEDVPAESPEVPVAEDAEQAARRLLDAKAAELGPPFHRARAAGRILSEHGQELMRVWDQYRALLGERASAGVFRQVLRERWAVDLGLGTPTEPGGEPGRGEGA